MSIQSFVMLSGTIMALVCSLGCARLDRRTLAEAEEPERAGAPAAKPNGSNTRDPAQSALPARGQGRESRGASAAEGGSAARQDAPQLIEATSSECEYAAPRAPGAACLASDPTEPNDQAQPARLPIVPLCGYLEANIAADDEDAFTFTTSRSDPVLIELSYQASGEADLQQSIYSATGDFLTIENDSRSAPGEDIRSVIQAVADASYVVRVKDTNDAGSCQSYALRVDPLYCSDEHEDNDSLKTPKKLLWDANERVTLVGALLESDQDFYEVTTERADPVQLTGIYTADPNSTVQVTRSAYDAAGSLEFSVSGDRQTDMESFSHWLSASSKGSVLRTRLAAYGTGCARYELTLDAAACTDAYEDNDHASEAAMLVPSTEAQVTIHESDEDFYALPALVAGSCAVAYDIPTGESQSLSLSLYDGSGSLVASKNGGELSGTVRRLQVSWTDNEVVSVKVSANGRGYCQPYTLRCDAE